MKGICFTEPLRRAIVVGRKTMRREIMSPQPLGPLSAAALRPAIRSDRRPRIGGSWWSAPTYARFIPGEIVYIKEPYHYDADRKRIFYKYEPADIGDLQELGFGDRIAQPWFWTHQLLMPASAARHFLRITHLRGERLKDITDEECRAEGICSDAAGSAFGLPNADGSSLEMVLGNSWREAFAALIDMVAGRGTWERNPWVWVYGFEFLAGLTPVERRLYKL